MKTRKTSLKQASKYINLVEKTGFFKLPAWIIALVIICTLLALTALTVTNPNVLPEFLGLEQSYTAKTKDFSKLEKVKVASVTDGDTLKLEDGRNVRYLNIDTPETKRANTPVQCWGPQASEANKQLVEGKEIWIVADKENTDRYDRLLRFIFLQESQTSDISQSVNAQLVKNGFARTSIYKPNNTYEDLFWKLEREAKEQNIGLWGNCERPFEK